MSIWISRAVLALFALVMAFLLYARSATASVPDYVAPEIDFLHTWLHPVPLAVATCGVPLLLGLVLPDLRRVSAQLAAKLALSAALAAAAVFVVVLLSQVEFLELPCIQSHGGATPTLRHSLLCPQFSGRSDGAPFSTGVLSSALFWVASRVQRSGARAAA